MSANRARVRGRVRSAKERTDAVRMSFRDSVHNPPRVRESADHSTVMRRIPAMDDRAFDRLTQRVSSAGSRRQALRAVLSAALVGATTTHAAAVRRASKGRGHQRCVDADCAPPPSPGTSASRVGNGGKAFCCSGTHCSCNGECCNNRCFWVGPEDAPTDEFCCTGPERIMCGGGADAKCCKNDGPNPCAKCIAPTGIAGSYRRP
jgi:hypothetical protein